MPRPYEGGFGFGVGLLRQRSHVAAHIGIIAGMWTHVETSIGSLFGDILDADAETGLAMYFSLVGEASRDAVVKAAAALKLDHALLKEFDALLAGLKRGPRLRRNNVVHGLWGITPELPDSLILLDAKSWLRWDSMSGKPHADQAAYERTMQAAGDFDNSPLEYTEADFVEIEEAIAQAFRDVRKFREKLRARSVRRSAGSQSPKG